MRRTPTSTPFPYTTLFRSAIAASGGGDSRLLLPRRTQAREQPRKQIGEAEKQGDRTRIPGDREIRSEEHTSELQSLRHLVCRLLLEKKKTKIKMIPISMIF